MPNKVALIFGYGPRVGVDVARAFASKGYRVAAVSRSKQGGTDTDDFMFLEGDLCEPSTVQAIFNTVIEKFGHPSVVIYNASGAAMFFDRSTRPEKSIPAFQADYNVNVVSAYIAAQLATESFNALAQGPGTYIYTGNKLNFIIVPPALSQGIGKAGAAHMINYLSEEYKDQGHKFYFADEREPDGNPVYSNIDGPAHAEFYMQLVERESQQPWLATFVKRQGYVDFHEAVPQKPGAMHPPKGE